jgi:hypothetical protein
MFPLISSNPKFFSLDSLAPSGLLTPEDKDIIRENIILYRNSQLSTAHVERNLEDFIKDVLVSEGNPEEGLSRENLTDMFREKGLSEVEKWKDQTTQKTSLVDVESVHTLKLNNNPHRIIIGGGFFTKEGHFSFQNVGNESEMSSKGGLSRKGSGLSGEEGFIAMDKNKVNKDFLEKSKDSISVEFESLLVTEKEAQKKKDQQQEAMRRKEDELEREVGYVSDRKFQITHISKQKMSKSEVLNMYEVVDFFDRIENRNNFLVTNLSRNRVYQFYYFVGKVLPIMRKKIQVIKENNVVLPETSRKSSQNAPFPPQELRKVSEPIQSPNKKNSSRNSGEQKLKQNNIFQKNNLSSISPSHLSNGSLNANSSFNLKAETQRNLTLNNEDKKKNIEQSESGERSRPINKKLKDKVMDEYGVGLFKDPPQMPRVSPANSQKPSNFLLSMLESNPKDTPKPSATKKKKTSRPSIRTRLKNKKQQPGYNPPLWKPNIPQYIPQQFGQHQAFAQKWNEFHHNNNMQTHYSGHPRNPHFNPHLTTQQKMMSHPENVHFNRLLHSDPNSLFFDYQTMKMGDQPMNHVPQAPRYSEHSINTSNPFLKMENFKSPNMDKMSNKVHNWIN